MTMETVPAAYGGSAYAWSQLERSPDGEVQRAEQVARGLGLFSLGLGLAQVIAPGGVARLIGLSDDWRTETTMRALGVREITSGLGLIAQPRRAGFAWSRVLGDVMDLALLGLAMGQTEPPPPRRIFRKGGDRYRLLGAAAAVIGVGVIDYLTSRRLSGAVRPAKATGIHVAKSITVNRPIEEVYAFWRSLENLPRFMSHLESVKIIDAKHSRWKASGPLGKELEWTAEILEERPNQQLAWQSLAGSDVPNWGLVRFVSAPGGRGTELHVELRYDPPGGKLAAAIAKLFGKEPSQQIAGDLRRFKQVIETGEVMRSDASIHPGMHAAQPPMRFRPTGEDR